jgi:hypothetical protein
MGDPLEDDQDQGRKAGVRILEDLIRTRDVAECINQVRLAASVDNKFNWHLIETIVAMAAKGFSIDPAKPSE